MYLPISKINELDFEKTGADKQIATIVDSLFHQNNGYITSLARTWDQNIRFFEGDQWIFYDTYKKTNSTIPVIDGVNDFIPRPVTNLIAPTIMTIASVFTKNKPTALVFSNSDSDADVSAARVGEAVLDTKWELDNEQVKLNQASKIALLAGTVFRKDYWDPTAQTTSIEDPGADEEITIGDSKVDYLTPFEVYFDIYGGRYVVEAKVTPIETIKMIYGRDGNGYTGRADEVQSDKNYNSILQYRENLRTLNASGSGSTSSSSTQSETAVLVECYIAPTSTFPRGLMVVEANGIPLYVADSPYYDKRVEDSWHPYTIFKWLESPTRWHGISLAEQLVPLQRRINGIDSFIMLSNMSNINPVWAINKASNVPEGYINGRPGLHIYYTGEAPQRMPGIGLPRDIYEERKRLLDELHFIAGDNLVLHGEQPSGVNTATGLQLLMEQSASKFNPYYSNWEKFLEKGQQKKLMLIAKNYIQDRPDFFEKIKHFSRNSNTIDIKNFIGADLRDNFTVRFEAGSSIPRSKLVEQQQLLDLQAKGLLGDVSPQGNPVANQKFLEKFGVRQFQGVTNQDLNKANFVVGVLKQINDDKLPEDDFPPFLPFENVDIHMDALVNEMKKPEFTDSKQVFQAKFQELMQAKEVMESQELIQETPMEDPGQNNPPQPPKNQPPATPEEIEQMLAQGELSPQ